MKCVKLQICLRHWHTARRHYLQPPIANASANVTIACFTSATPARRGRVAGAACSYAGIGLRLRRTQPASARTDKKASYIYSASIVVKSGMPSQPLQTKSAPDSGRMTGKPEVIALSVGLVPINVLELTGRANFRVVGYSETEPLPHGRSTAKRQTAPLLRSARNRKLNCRP